MGIFLPFVLNLFRTSNFGFRIFPLRCYQFITDKRYLPAIR